MTEPMDPGELAWAARAVRGTPPVPAYRQTGGPYPEPPGNLGYTPDQPYVAPAYPAPAYPGQPYPGQPYPGQPYPAVPYEPNWLTAQPPRKARRRPIAVGLVMVLAAAGIVAAVVSGSGSNSPSSAGLTLPSSLAGDAMLPGGTADAIRSSIGQGYGTTSELGTFFATATIGAYGVGGQPPPTYVLIAARAGAFPDLNANSIAGGVAGAFGLSSYPAGSHGGVVDCLDESFGGGGETVCFWSDSRTVGYLLAIDAAGTSDVAALVNTARDTLDR